MIRKLITIISYFIEHYGCVVYICSIEKLYLHR